MAYTIIRAGGRLWIYSWTEGCKEVILPKLRTENDLQAYLLWLVNQGRGDEADLLLEQFCS